jgi:hypothetical protein
MSSFRNTETNVVVTVADDKDERFTSPLWEKQSAAKKSTSSSK